MKKAKQNHPLLIEFLLFFCKSGLQIDLSLRGRYVLKKEEKKTKKCALKLDFGFKKKSDFCLCCYFQVLLLHPCIGGAAH